jgi:hypothetical protein
MALSDTGLGVLVCAAVFVVLCPCLFYWILLPNLYDDEESTTDNFEHEEVEFEKYKRKREHPAIVIGETQSSDDDSDTQDLEAQQEPKNTKRRNDPSFVNSIGNSRSSHETSVSEQATTVDVHVCNSSSCKLCRQKNDGVTFVTVKPLEPKMVGKLRQGPGSWWEFGESFFDLYTQANNPTGASRSTRDENDGSSIWGIPTKSSRKKRSVKMVSSDGDEHF